MVTSAIMEWTRWLPHCKHRIKGENFEPSYTSFRIVITGILPFLWWIMTLNLISILTFAIAWCFPLSFLRLPHSVKFRPTWPCPLSCSLFLSKRPSQTPVLTLLGHNDLNSTSNKYSWPVTLISSKNSLIQSHLHFAWFRHRGMQGWTSWWLKIPLLTCSSLALIG